MSQLNIKEIVSISVETYKEKWDTLLLISFLKSLISVSVGAVGIIIAWTMVFSPTRVFLPFINLGLFIISFYFISRLYVALIMASKSALGNEDIGVSAAYSRAKPLTWRYIGFALLFGLVILLPSILVVVGAEFGGHFGILWSIRGVLIVLGVVSMIYILTVFGFSLFAAVLHPHESSVFTYSKNLVKGNFMKVFLIMLIPLIISSPFLAISLIFKVNQANVYIQIGVSILRAIPGIVITPFSLLLILETMNRLEIDAQPKIELESQVNL